METLEMKVARLTSELEALSAQVPRNETQINLTSISLDEAKAELAQEQVTVKIQQDHEERVSQSTDELFNEVDNIEITNGMRLRDIIIDEILYQQASIVLKGLFQAKVDKLSQVIASLEGENGELTTRLRKSTDDQQRLETELNQERLDHAQTQQYRTNLSALLEEAQKEITQLKEQLTAATAGVKTTNTEEERRKKAENDARIKLTRTIYNRVADNNLFPKLYTANLAATGEQITFPSYAVNSYIVIQESEVPQFRQDNGITETTTPSTDNTTAEPVTEAVQDSVTPEGGFPAIPKAELPNTPDPVDQGQPSGEVPAAADGAVTRAEFEALKKRLVEVEKVCNIGEIGEETAA